MMRTRELMFVTWLVLLQVAVAKNDPRNCRETCGNLTLDYPFGITDDCYLNESQGFRVDCIDGVPTLAANRSFTILEIRLPNQVLIETTKIMAVDCRYNGSKTHRRQPFNLSVSINLPEPFKVSSGGNRFRAMGCDTMAYINNTGESDGYDFGSRCETQWMVGGGGRKHGGLGQCQIAVPDGSADYLYNVTNQFNYTKSACTRSCSYAFLADELYQMNSSVLNDYVDEGKQTVNNGIRFPLVGEWVIKDSQCEKTTSPICGDNAECTNYTWSSSGYYCNCKQDYKGNPYLKGPAGCSKDKDGPKFIIVLAIAGGFALAGTLGASSYAYGSWAEKKLIMRTTMKFLNELKDSVDFPDTPEGPDSANPDQNFPDIDDTAPEEDANPYANPGDANAGDKPKDFNQQDLKKAIKLYQKGRRVALWARRHMVARANLANNEAVEIRKYIVQDRGQLKPFVIGVRTLSRTVIHANVARLLGISTRDSSLIYRYFSDKTLHDRLHSSRTDRPSWEERLKIALGTARGLAFAHSKGLYHGNVKSSNILLDENCNCKVVEFGVVRVWRRNKLLNSSKGCVDPEYLKQSNNQLTSKMDVYSFGVVLVELITGQDPSAKAFNQRERSLALQFTLAVEKKQLQELVDNRIWAEERRAQLEDVADIAALCLQQEAEGRPKMFEVRNKLWKRARELHPTREANLTAGNRPVAGQFDNLQGQVGKMQGQYDKIQGQLGEMQDLHDKVNETMNGLE